MFGRESRHDKAARLRAAHGEAVRQRDAASLSPTTTPQEYQAASTAATAAAIAAGRAADDAAPRYLRVRIPRGRRS
ncbi:hypothetical protein FF36_05997 [Frankia torreyi]|uniref:Uncharacterized protein n=1 Tax=Frankia torreyi TaxID=1856 RepID=A0A0D8B8Q1_9ACTN|nr:hypothetical protein FF36_05997 [Frankia torreyi]